MKKYLKVASMMLSMVLLFSLSIGCTVRKDNTSTAPKATSAATTVGSVSAKQEPVPIKLFISIGPEFQPENNIVVQELEKLTNTKLTFEIPPQSNYQERLQIIFVTKELPDAVQIDNPTNKLFVNAVNDGLIIPITKQVQNSPNLLKYTNPISWDSLRVKGDDDIYGIPRCTLNRADGFGVREDWLENVGMSVPSDGIITLDEFTEILKRFTKNDPDKNGKDDTYGISLPVKEDGALLPILTATFGILGWQKYNDEPYEYMNIQYSKSKDNYKKALEYTAMLWKEGYIDPNWPNNKAELEITRFKQGISGMYPGFANFTTHLGQLKSNIPNARMTYITRVKLGPDASIKGVGFGTGMWWFTAITKNAADKVDAVVGLFDKMLDDKGWSLIKNGVEGIHYTKSGDTLTFTPQFNDYLKWRNGVLLVRRYLDVDCFIPAGNIEPALYERILNWTDICAKEMVMSKDRGYKPPVANEPEFIDYQKTMNQGISKIIVGASPVSEWDKILDGWYKAGGEEYVKQMNEFIKSMEK